MKHTKTVPQENVEFKIESIAFDIPAKTANCSVERVNSTEPNRGVLVDLKPALNAATEKELATIKKFFKWIMAQGFEVAQEELTEEVFD